MKDPALFICLSGRIENYCYLNSLVIPQINSTIYFKSKRYKVVDILYNYSQVEDYDTLEDSDRGGETIYIYVKSV